MSVTAIIAITDVSCAIGWFSDMIMHEYTGCHNKK